MQEYVALNNLEEIIEYFQQHPKSDAFFTLPKNAYAYMGVSYIEEMLCIASANFPNIYNRFVLNIGDNPAIFHKLLKSKIKHISFSGSVDMYKKLENLASKFDITLYRS